MANLYLLFDSNVLKGEIKDMLRQPVKVCLSLSVS